MPMMGSRQPVLGVIFEKVNQTEFQPGDHVLLNAQSTWNNQLLHPKGMGQRHKRLSLIL